MAGLARRLLKERMQRSQFIDSALFSEPAWNMMLDMFISRARGCRLTVSDVTLGSGAPHATATRWLQRMAATGLVHRSVDERDARRVFVELTDSATERMISYLEGVRKGTCESCELVP